MGGCGRGGVKLGIQAEGNLGMQKRGGESRIQGKINLGNQGEVKLGIQGEENLMQGEVIL